MATEDNTVVTATWNGNVTFINGTPPANTHTFTLNKGQSFICRSSGNGRPQSLLFYRS
ncbi:hypothetical protein ACFOEQ_01600 [Chryseobacterium arachidis]|uniref:hypothetical protein n=1 Tax=Chryseobacterium arachidis TaxID=1416778 RepID=UPI00360A5F37